MFIASLVIIQIVNQIHSNKQISQYTEGPPIPSMSRSGTTDRFLHIPLLQHAFSFQPELSDPPDW